MSKPKAPCAGVIVFDPSMTKVVLIATHNDVWGFPKGKREKTDRSVVDAALRELEEESGLSITDIKLISTETIVENSRRGNPATEYFVGVLFNHSPNFNPKDVDEIKCVKLVTFEQANKLLDERRQQSLQTAQLIANGSDQHS
jgi:8-oxo-dGTP pyrophosphatase MutT (NUDIX family)